MNRAVVKTLSWMSVFAIVASMCTMLALAAGNPVYQSIDNYRDDMGVDIKVMTYNILEYNNTDYYFQFGDNDYNKRFENVVTSITAYDADVVGIQEAASSQFDWPGKLISRLGSTYGYIRLDKQSGGPSSLNIARGLIIFYKKDRFTVQSNGCQQFNITVSSGGYKRTDTSRWFQWAKLRDTKHNNQDFYFFNTHFAIGADISGSSAANDLILEKMVRTEQARILSDKIHSLSANLPFFSTGDYNCPLTTSESDQAAGHSYDQLCRMNAAPHTYIMSTMRFADLLIGHAGSSVDHIYSHTSFVDVLKLVGVKESTKGITASDHFAYVAYCNYRANALVKNGKYDKVTGTHTDTSTTGSYTYSITRDSRLTHKIYDAKGNLCSNTVELKNAANTFEIRFYIAATGALYDTIKSTIRYTGADKPIVQVSGAVNHYFANGAYQVAVAKDTPSVALNFNRGTLYNDAACTVPQNGSIPNLPAGRTVLYLKTDAEIFPVYIYKETFAASTDPMEFYVDDDIGNAVGIVAFWNGSGVCLIEGQVKGFDSLLDLRDEVNKSDGRTLNVAPGNYEGLGANTYNSSVTILGPNAGRSPHIRYVDNVWVYNEAGRLEEAVIHGDLRFATSGSSSIDRITVKGLKFVGESYWGPISINDVRRSDSISPQGFVTKLDISYNIFEGWGTQGNAAAVWANTRVQKTGIIEHNWFNCTKNTSFEGTYTRAIFMRNINGLTIESNRFSNYEVVFFVTSEITAGDTTPGHLNMTVSGNRFEYCDRLLNYVRNLYGGTTAHLKYLDNTFIRCGFNSGALYLDLGETSAACGNNYAKCSLDIIGNRFFGCGRSITLYRNHLTDDGSTGLTGDLSQMTVNLTQNVFYDPLERPPGEGFAGLSGAATASINFCFVVKPTGALGGALGSKWKLSHNYFYSGRLALDYSGTAVNNPDLYCCNYYSKGSGNTGKSFSDSGKLAPYYTGWSNNTFTAISSGSIQSMNVTVTNYNGTYDGQPHTFTVNAPAGATVAYSTNANGGTGAAFQTTPVTRTAVGTTQVAYRVTCPGYTTVYGTASITIAKGAASTQVIADKTVTYQYGRQRQLDDFTNLRDGDVLTYTYNGTTYSEMPTFTEVGVYKVNIKVTNPYYNTYDKTATLTIKKASLDYVTISGGYEGVYNGVTRKVTVSGAPENVIPLYSLDGGEFTTQSPTFTNVTDGKHTVTVRLQNNNYITREKTVTFCITPAPISGITLSGTTAQADGTAKSLVTLDGTKSGDTVQYSLNGHAFTTAAPTASKAGTYLVAVKISRPNHLDKTLIATAVLSETYVDPALFTLSIGQKSVRTNDDKYTFGWQLQLDVTQAGNAAVASSDLMVTSYGIKYAETLEDLSEYIFLMQHKQNPAAEKMIADGKVCDYACKQSETGITMLYPTNIYNVDNINPGAARYAAFYITYTIDGVAYEQYSVIDCTSSLAGDGWIEGVGGTESADDILQKAE